MNLFNDSTYNGSQLFEVFKLQYVNTILWNKLFTIWTFMFYLACKLQIFFTNLPVCTVNCNQVCGQQTQTALYVHVVHFSHLFQQLYLLPCADRGIYGFKTYGGEEYSRGNNRGLFSMSFLGSRIFFKLTFIQSTSRDHPPLQTLFRKQLDLDCRYTQ